jgi:hypothetical protein
MPADGHVGRGPAAGLAVVTRSEVAFLREHFADWEPPARRLTGEPVRVVVGLRIRA